MEKEILSLETAKKLADYEKLQKENEEMKKDLSNIVDLMYLNVIKKEGETYKPIKNLSKQDVYEIYYKIQEILETRRIRRKYIVSNEEKKK